ncbi:MAG TPA: GNAT family N-acetyltransferase [Sphingobacteriaceae bacterium]
MDPKIEMVFKSDYDEITSVWEASVRATHHFLSEEDIAGYRELFPACFQSLELYCIRQNNCIAGFIGIAHHKVEMLFIHPEARGKGLGKQLMSYAIHDLQARKVDVNEQNEQAAGFYLTFGFTVAGRSERDGLNKPYPLLHLKLPD